MPYGHLGEALATDYFLVRDQFSGEEWRSPHDDVDGEVKRFLVEQRTPGSHAQRIHGKGAVRAIWQADITLDEVRVPLANRLPGATFKDAGRDLVATRGVCAWAALGGTETMQALIVGRDITGIGAFR